MLRSIVMTPALISFVLVSGRDLMEPFLSKNKIKGGAGINYQPRKILNKHALPLTNLRHHVTAIGTLTVRGSTMYCHVSFALNVRSSFYDLLLVDCCTACVTDAPFLLACAHLPCITFSPCDVEIHSAFGTWTTSRAAVSQTVVFLYHFVTVLMNDPSRDGFAPIEVLP